MTPSVKFLELRINLSKLTCEFCKTKGKFDWHEWHALVNGFFDGFSPFKVPYDLAFHKHEPNWWYYSSFRTLGSWASVIVWTGLVLFAAHKILNYIVVLMLFS